MSNTLVTCSVIAKESLAILENLCGFSGAVNRDWEDEFTGNMSRGYAPGQTINIKRPPRYTYRSGRVASPQATVESSVPLTLQQGGTDLNFTGIERTLSLTKLEGKLQAAMATVANEIDRQGLDLARLATYNAVGTVGTLPNTQASALASITAVNQRLDEMAAPRDKQRALILSPAMNGALVQGFAGLYNPTGSISSMMKGGTMVDSLGLTYAMDQNVATHTNGSQPVGSGTVNGAGQTGATLNVNSGTITGTVKAGSVFTMPGVYAVNPQSRQSTGQLMQFVVTADAAISASSLSISPAIVTSGAFQNVTASPANGAAINFIGSASGSYQSNIGFHKDAFTLAMVPMYAPPGGKGVIDVAQESYNGFNIKVTEFYDGTNDNYIMRLDVLFGWAATYPELATKLVY